MIWTRPKLIGPIQNDWCLTKMIWTVQNHFRPVEGQGISMLLESGTKIGFTVCAPEKTVT